MNFTTGFLPDPDPIPRASRCRRVSVRVAALGAVALLAAAAGAQSAIPLTLAEAEDLALEAEPGIAALHARSDAMDELAVSAGELPDPTLRVGLNNFPIESGGFATEGMTSATVGLRQAFPAGDSRAIRASRYARLAGAVGADAEARARDVLLQARVAWLEAYYWQSATDIVESSRPLFADLVEVTRSLYAVGRRDRQDLLRAELELARLDDRLVAIADRLERSRAGLGEWIGAASSRPAARKLPAWDSLPDADALRARLEAHPRVAAAEARIEAQDAGVALAREDFKPGWALDLGYSMRDGALPNGAPRSDFVSLSVTVDLPVFRRNRQDRALASALSERRAARYERDAIAAELGAQLDTALARWRALSRRLDLFESRILVQAGDRADAALDAYGSDDADFADVMRGRIDELEAQLDHVRILVDRAQTYAVLANLGGLQR